MKIALDAMGGDFAPLESVKGSVEALLENKDLSIILVGDKAKIEEELKKYNYDKDRIQIEHTDEAILMNEEMAPVMAVRKKKKASMNIALDLVKEEKADACISGGNTGALMSASLMKLGRIKGVARPAITALIPNKKDKMVLLDVGANADCKPEYLEQFAIMGSLYAKLLLKKTRPSVGLLNIGEEEGKGNELVKSTYELLKENTEINFIGNIEAREMMEGNVDVVVADGFTGNVVLKAMEGTASIILGILKQEIKESFICKIGALLLKPVFMKLKKKLDSRESGGAIFLGLDGISIKAHGNSDALAFKNAIKVAVLFAENEFIEKLKQVVGSEEKNEA